MQGTEPSHSRRRRKPPSAMSGGEANDIWRERFVFKRVWTALLKLDPDSAEIAWIMFRHLYGVVIEPFDRIVRAVQVQHGTGAGPYWIWSQFPQLNGAELVSVHPLNGNSPYVMDFAIPNSGRSRMTMFEARVPRGFDPCV